jgi:hypothetical protein
MMCSTVVISRIGGVQISTGAVREAVELVGEAEARRLLPESLWEETPDGKVREGT